jgi:hypothetical protein
VKGDGGRGEGLAGNYNLLLNAVLAWRLLLRGREDLKKLGALGLTRAIISGDALMSHMLCSDLFNLFNFGVDCIFFHPITSHSDHSASLNDTQPSEFIEHNAIAGLSRLLPKRYRSPN